MHGLVKLLDETMITGSGFVIPYNPFDMEFLTPFFSDLIGKITLGATIGLAGFLLISGFYAVVGFIKGLFK